MTHRNLALEIPRRLERDADHDQQRGAAEREGLEHGVAGHRKHDREHGDKTEEERADEGNAVENLLDVIGRRLAGTVAEDGAAVLPECCSPPSTGLKEIEL